jgi:hypothetical protein
VVLPAQCRVVGREQRRKRVGLSRALPRSATSDAGGTAPPPRMKGNVLSDWSELVYEQYESWDGDFDYNAQREFMNKLMERVMAEALAMLVSVPFPDDDEDDDEKYEIEYEKARVRAHEAFHLALERCTRP